ncbi:MAG: bifunctional 5,10-methylenetetrahydrofolate dehydrogenase/5,10-methenyltetrahydrofolate cyclohydrolase [bacterium]|nr:bifunctional 5,10-methylenetetrahydrofolate dehydrogenase/5,10-methenyltetrahydrofolate cyclohydrolase [bacterium]
MILLDGKTLASKIQNDLKAAVKKLTTKPTLGIILVGSDPASEHYVGIKQRDGEQLGFEVIVHRLPKKSSQKTLTFAIENLNRRNDVHGIIVQLPLPDHLNALVSLSTIDPAKDVDGFHPLNIGLLALGLPAFQAATPAGIMRLLDAYQVPIAGKHAVVVGRSITVGKPIASMLLNRDATVTVCHSKTKRLSEHTKTADILIVSVGKPKLITGAMIKKGACVIDVGMTRTSKGWVGDVDFASASKIAQWISPVPGGVGPMTVAILFENTLRANRAQQLVREKKSRQQARS